MRLLLWLLIGLAVVWLVKGLRRPAEPGDRADPAGRTAPEADRPVAPATPATPATVQLMVRCAHCGVHLPGRDALTAQGRDYCSAAHRDAGPRVAARD